MVQLPSGTVTFLFSDVEGSTQLLERHGAAMGTALARHLALFEQIIERHGGVIFETVGDAVYAAFSSADSAVAAALDAQRALAAEDWGPIGHIAVRIALHSGAVEQRGAHYFGPALFRVARLQALGYGEQTLLSGVTAGLAADALPEGASLRDLGSHRLKDLGQPEQVYQLVHPDLRAEFPPLKSLDAHPHNLPLQLSSFVGRQAELAEIRQLLGKHRLVTLLGPGGIGKTRLALHAAADAIDSFPDGVFFVDLAAVRDPELVPGAVASNVGLREQPGEPILRTLTQHLRSKGLLLVLDNLEQLLPAAALAVADLLAAADNLHVLATSRAPLRIRGEQEYGVPTLAAGDTRRLDDAPPPAVTLFVERARAIRPDLTVDEQSGPVIAAICARLDGLPLAIELAAARLRLFSLSALNERLERRLPLLAGGARDLPERQQTLRAAIAWSEELLREPEQRLLARLGVFVGGFTLEAAEAVAGPDVGGDILDALSALLEQSLVRQNEGVADEPRYTMLETIREYALERLGSADQRSAVMGRLADHLITLTAALEPRLLTAEQSQAELQLDTELANLRSVLSWLEEERDGLGLAQLASSLGRYWMSRGLLSEGRRWVHTAQALLVTGHDALSAKLLHADGMLATELGAAAEGSVLLNEAATRYRSLGADGELTRVLVALSHAEQTRGAFSEAVAAASEARRLAQTIGDVRSEASATGNLALVALKQGDLEDAEVGLTEALTLFRRTGDQRAVVIGLGNLGALVARRGDHLAATSLHLQALDGARSLGDGDLEGWALTNIAGGEIKTGDLKAAADHLQLGLRKLIEAEDSLAAASAVDTMGRLLARCGDAAGAAIAWSAASAIAAGLGISIERDGDDETEIATTRDLLEPSAWEESCQRGAELDLTQAMDALLPRLRDAAAEAGAAGVESTVAGE